MANMSVNQRAQYERVDLSVPVDRHPGFQPPPADQSYTAVALVVLGALSYADDRGDRRLGDWPSSSAMIFVTTIGVMIALIRSAKLAPS